MKFLPKHFFWRTSVTASYLIGSKYLANSFSSGDGEKLNYWNSSKSYHKGFLPAHCLNLTAYVKMTEYIDFALSDLVFYLKIQNFPKPRPIFSLFDFWQFHLWSRQSNHSAPIGNLDYCDFQVRLLNMVIRQKKKCVSGSPTDPSSNPPTLAFLFFFLHFPKNKTWK